VSYQTRVRIEAERDIEEAALWYQRQREDLGQAFLDEVIKPVEIEIGIGIEIGIVVELLADRSDFDFDFDTDEPVSSA